MDAPDEKDGKPNYQFSALVALLIAAALAAVGLNGTPVPDSARPSPGAISATEGPRADARLWDDPLELLPPPQARAAPGKMPEPCVDELSWPANDASRTGGSDARGTAPSRLKLVVLADSGRSAEDTERRIRARAAVLSALNRWGYEPQDAEHLSVLCFNANGQIFFASVEQFQLVVDDSLRQRSRRVEQRDPYEGRAAQVRVYWIGDAPLRGSAAPGVAWEKYASWLRMLAAPPATPANPPVNPPRADAVPPAEPAAAQSAPTADATPTATRSAPQAPRAMAPCPPRANPAERIVLLGPLNRDVADMLEQAFRESRCDSTPVHRTFTPFRTHPAGSEVSAVSQDDFEVGRPDEVLADALISELELRGLNLTRPDEHYGMLPAGVNTEVQRYACLFDDHVALISEWDTRYAREFRRAFSGRLGDSAASLKAELRRSDVPNLHGFGFTRGLDGKSLRPSSGGDKDGGRKGVTGAKQTEPEDFERSVGTSQRDYVRRLADQIESRDAALRTMCGRDSTGIHAVGILASDFYDKLMLLQTLRARLPNILFFTTGLDARLLDRQNTGVTRNLLVASHFDEELAPPIQRYIIPFRDSSQTALFFATSLALLHATADDPSVVHRSLGRWETLRPRVFEIGLTQAHSLNEFQSDEPCQLSSNNETPDNLFKCADVHPPRARPQSGALKAAIGLLFAVISVYLLGATLWAPARAAVFPLVLVTGLVLLLLPLALFRAFSLTHGFANEEPLAWLDGVSIWPGLWLRWIALVVGIALLVMAARQITGSIAQVAASFGLSRLRVRRGHPLKRVGHAARTAGRILWWRLRCAVMGHRRMPGYATRRPEAARAWLRFRRGVMPGPQCLIGAVWAILVIVLMVQVWRSHPTLVPIRGPLTTALFNVIATANGFVFLLLLFLSLSISLRLRVLARDLTSGPSAWPATAVRLARARIQAELCDPLTLARASDEARVAAEQHPDEETPAAGSPAKQNGFSEALDLYIDTSLIAIVSRSNEWAVYAPGIVLSLILASRWGYFDAWSLDPVAVTVFTLFGAGAILTVIVDNAAAREARGYALSRLDRIEARTSPENVHLLRFVQLVRRHVQTLHDGVFRAGRWNLMRALLLPVASATGLRGIEALMAVFQ